MNERTKLIGVDPSFITCGIAIKHCDQDGLLELHSGTIDACIAWMNKRVHPSEIIAIMEDPNLDSAVFGSWQQMSRAIKTGDQKEMRSVFSRLQKHAQRIGDQKAAAARLEKMFKDAGIPMIRVAPSSRQRADKSNKDPRFLTRPTKTNKEQFKLITNYIGQSNEHSRDAGILIHDQTVPKSMVLLKTGGVIKERPWLRKSRRA